MARRAMREAGRAGRLADVRTGVRRLSEQGGFDVAPNRAGCFFDWVELGKSVRAGNRQTQSLAFEQ